MDDWLLTRDYCYSRLRRKKKITRGLSYKIERESEFYWPRPNSPPIRFKSKTYSPGLFPECSLSSPPIELIILLQAPAVPTQNWQNSLHLLLMSLFSVTFKIVLLCAYISAHSGDLKMDWFHGILTRFQQWVRFFPEKVNIERHTKLRYSDCFFYNTPHVVYFQYLWDWKFWQERSGLWTRTWWHCSFIDSERDTD